MKVAFGTVIYQEAWEYSEDFLDSLNQQTINFDLIIINDNCTKEQVSNLIEKSKNKIIVKDIEKSLSPAELRIELILYTKSLGYDLLILGDFDDIFMNNRVEMISHSYSLDYTFYYNELYDFNNKNIMVSIPMNTNSFMDISEYNYIGLSNSALLLKNISYDFLESMREDKVKVFDWYFFTRILLENQKGLLVEKTGTFYRIHNNNIAGITNLNMDKTAIIKEVNIKIRHYEVLKKYEKFFIGKYDYYKRLLSEIENDKSVITMQDQNEFWWGLIRE